MKTSGKLKVGDLVVFKIEAQNLGRAVCRIREECDWSIIGVLVLTTKNKSKNVWFCKKDCRKLTTKDYLSLC